MPFKNPHPLYSIWQGMKRRCDNPNHRQYKDYGGRGIKVCDEWVGDFHQFATDMGPRPDGYTLDRIDNDGDYTPENTRWASRKQQQRNQRRTRFVFIEGIKHMVAELSERYGVKGDTIVDRAAKGMTFDEVTFQGRHKFTPSEQQIKNAVAARIKSTAKVCKNGHPRTPENTHITRQGWHSCRICAREKSARQRAEKKQRQFSPE